VGKLLTWQSKRMIIPGFDREDVEHLAGILLRHSEWKSRDL